MSLAEIKPVNLKTLELKQSNLKHREKRLNKYNLRD